MADVFVRARFPLGRLARDKSVEVIEAAPGGPAVKWPIAVVWVTGELCHLPRVPVLDS